MDFKDAILQLAEKIEKQMDTITTEEGTKNAFVMPMISALGYDVFNPFEVVPEMDCDLIKKKGEKIDYAIIKDEKPILLIECKHCKENLNLHNTQLQKYFVASNARFGVLTNGIEYRFYTDLDKSNIMDEKPFLIINMLNISDSDIEQLKKFHKSYYNESEILTTAEQLQILTSIKDIVANDFTTPSQEFVRYFVKATNDGHYNQSQVEKYTPILKRAISLYINEVISDRLNFAAKNQEEQTDTANTIQEEKKEEKLPEGVVSQDESTGIITTQEEIDAYNIIRSILRKNVDASKITYKDTKSYFVVSYNESSWYWICRISLKQYSKRICFPKDNYKSNEWFDLSSIDDIFNYSDKLIESLKTAIRE
jgi:Uncharacterized conserved protein